MRNCGLISALSRTLIFESTKLISDPTQTESILEYDTSLHRKLSMNQMFVFNKIHVVNKGLFTYPVRSFFIFAHNQPINVKQFKEHPLIEQLRNITTKEELI